MYRFSVPSTTARNENVILGDGWRVTVLTDRMIRVETSRNGVFTDEPTQTVWYRDLGAVNYKSEKMGTSLVVSTGTVAFFFNGSTSNPRVLVQLEKGARLVDAFSKEGNLKGTRRTLDFTKGKVKLGQGLMSKKGVTHIDDSKTYVLDERGIIAARKSSPDAKDFYVLAYGHDYRGCLVDYYRLTGNVPMVPRFALGNWWSRYYPYSEETYNSLMDEFEKRDIPLTVATIDMDWHWVKDTPADAECKTMQGRGWTGYSWNTNLFPDYKRFLRGLKDRGLAVTMNLHPCDGVRYYEDMYPEMARAMGVDPATKAQIPFDMTDEKFIENYFDVVHHPYEEDGVDFWWIDWQQGKHTKFKGLDPLWLLNHYHSLDSGRKGRPLILSRYAEEGSHRYPLGFSGDVIIDWKSLKFQPYFTSTASNVGYGWWSHDIGGHNFGANDDELYLRWVQYGVFSPINRLHSTRGKFTGKEPWIYRCDVNNIATDFLRFRHRLIPYLYTMNERAAKESLPLVQPMYYAYPEEKSAYKVKNQYYFGTELVVCPIAERISRKFILAGANMWLPEGTRWTDIFTGQTYGGGKHYVCRQLDSIPVLAKEGAIIPLQSADEKADVPDNLEVWLYCGNGEFSLYEDMDAKGEEFARTKMTMEEVNVDGKSTERFTVYPAEGKFLRGRTYTVVLKDAKAAKCLVDGVEVEGDSIIVPARDVPVVVEFEDVKMPEKPCLNDRLEAVLQAHRLSHTLRQPLFYLLSNLKTDRARRVMIALLPVCIRAKRALLEEL